MKAVITVTGLVQGVGYRFFCVRQAQQHNIRGYVQNLGNGDVQVVAEGSRGVINDFVKRLKVGPVSAHVTGIDVQYSEEEKGFDTFDVRFS